MFVLREVSQQEVNDILRQGGPDVSGMDHVLVAHEIKHAAKHGRPDETSRFPNQRPLTKADILRIPVVLDGYDAIKVQARGTNRTSLIYSKQFSDGRIEYIERVIETSGKNKPRLVTKTAWVVATTGVESSLTQVYAPDRQASLPFSMGRVNPSAVSKVVDAQGNPLVVYRGERTDFGNMPTGATYFAENPRWANRFAGKSSGANVIPAYLAIANPLDLTSFGETPISKELLQSFLSGKGVVLDFSDAGGPMPVYEFVRRWGFAKAVLDAGFDGVKQMEGRGEGRRATSLDTVAWLSFKPTQIKSATGNNGNFDGTNPDIRFSRGPVAAARDTLAAARELNLAAGYQQRGKTCCRPHSEATASTSSAM